MKTPSDKLFSLISSLTKSEKRYFKRFAMIHSMKDGNSYLELFDEIEKQKTYNEEALKKKLEKIREVKYLSVEKAYLYNLILRSLVLYGSGHDDYESIIEAFSKGKILFKKGLYSEALNYINKAIDIAVKEEYFSLAAGIERWKREILIKQGVFFTKKISDTFYKEILEKILLEKNIQKYQQASDITYLQLITGHTARSKKDSETIRNRIKDLIDKKDSGPLTITSHRLKHQAASFYYFYTGDYKKKYEESAKALEWAEKQKSKTGVYFRSLHNFFNGCMAVKKYDELFPILKKLEAIDTSSDFSEQYRRETFFHLNLAAATNCADFDYAIDYLQKNEKHIIDTPHQNITPDLQVGAFNAAFVYFIRGKYSQAVKWLNKFFFMNSNSVELRQDLYGEASLMFIVLHYELKNEDLLKSLIKSTYRWLLKQERLHGFEKAILNFIRKELAIPKKRKELLIAFSKLRSHLLKLKKEQYESRAFDFFDLTLWLDSKIENIPLDKILKTRYSKT